MRLFKIIKKPITTEKSAMLELDSTYVVEVDEASTKIDIKKAVLETYWVEVASVRVLNTTEKFKQWKKWPVHRRRTTKKAYVTLKDSKSKIDFSVLK